MVLVSGFRVSDFRSSIMGTPIPLDRPFPQGSAHVPVCVVAIYIASSSEATIWWK